MRRSLVEAPVESAVDALNACFDSFDYCSPDTLPLWLNRIIVDCHLAAIRFALPWPTVVRSSLAKLGSLVRRWAHSDNSDSLYGNSFTPGCTHTLCPFYRLFAHCAIGELKTFRLLIRELQRVQLAMLSFCSTGYHIYFIVQLPNSLQRIKVRST